MSKERFRNRRMRGKRSLGTQVALVEKSDTGFNVSVSDGSRADVEGIFRLGPVKCYMRDFAPLGLLAHSAFGMERIAIACDGGSERLASVAGDAVTIFDCHRNAGALIPSGDLEMLPPPPDSIFERFRWVYRGKVDGIENLEELAAAQARRTIESTVCRIMNCNIAVLAACGELGEVDCLRFAANLLSGHESRVLSIARRRPAPFASTREELVARRLVISPNSGYYEPLSGFRNRCEDVSAICSAYFASSFQELLAVSLDEDTDPIDGLIELTCVSGADHAISAYYSGVPLEDIVTERDSSSDTF